MNVTGLLAFVAGAGKTTSGPEVAPTGIIIVIEVSLQALIVACAPFNNTMPEPCEAPKPIPEITTWPPIAPVVAETLLITGAGVVAELTDTLSNVAVARLLVLPLLTAIPTYTFCPRLIVRLLPICAQFTPSVDE